MKKISIFALLTLGCCFSAFGQSDGLSSVMIGSGMSWLRGATYPLNNETTFSKRLGGSNWFATGDVVTPIVKTPVGSPPIPSTITAGADYAVACNGTKSVCLLLTALGGLSAASGGAAASPAFTGALKLWFHVGPIYIVPQAKVSNASYSPSSGALATAVFSPALQIMYGFGTTTAATVAPTPTTPTVKQMRAVLKRLRLPMEDVK